MRGCAWYVMVRSCQVLHTCLPTPAFCFYRRNRERRFREIGGFISSLVHQCVEVGVGLEVLRSVRFEQVRRRFEA
jgi:hypothetical protein